MRHLVAPMLFLCACGGGFTASTGDDGGPELEAGRDTQAQADASPDAGADACSPHPAYTNDPNKYDLFGTVCGVNTICKALTLNVCDPYSPIANLACMQGRNAGPQQCLMRCGDCSSGCPDAGSPNYGAFHLCSMACTSIGGEVLADGICYPL